MKVPAVLMTDHLGEVAASFDASESITVEALPVMADVKTNSAFLEFRDASDRENPHRPYLHIIGQVDEVRGEFPYDVTSASVADGVPVDIFYEFTDQELANMTLKGMYRRGFEVPVELLRYPMVDLPMNCNVQAFYEEQSGIPIMFIEVVDAHTLTMDKATSGYTLGDYFKEPVVQNDFDSQFGEQFASIDVSKFDFENAFKSFETFEPEAEDEIELSDEERKLVEHYMNVNQRVTDLHLNGQLTPDEIMGRDKYDTLEIEPMELDLQPEDMGVAAPTPSPEQKDAEKTAREKAIADAVALLKTVPEYKSLVTDEPKQSEAKVLGAEEKSAEVTVDEVVSEPEAEDAAAHRARERQRIAREAADAAVERAETGVSVDDLAVTDHESKVDFVVSDPKTEATSVSMPQGFAAVDPQPTAPTESEQFDPLASIRAELADAKTEDVFASQFANLESGDIESVLKAEEPEPEPQENPQHAERKAPTVAEPAVGEDKSMDF